MQDIYISIGQNIRRRRKEKHLTQESLAANVETSAQYISRIERGQVCPSLEFLYLYIQCFLSYNDTLSTDFRWFCVNFNHFDDEDSHFLPDETMNKLFTGADGETLYTDDGYQYKLSTMPWCQDGTCKR